MTSSPGDHVEGGQMTAIVESIDISRRPEDVFRYVTDPAHLSEWQVSIESVHRQGDAAAAVGSRYVVTRRIGRREMQATTQVSALDPPRSWGFRTVDGPVRGIETGTIEPLDDGKRSRVTISLEFETRGIGKLLAPLVVRP